MGVLFNEGRTLDELAEQFGVQRATVANNLAEFVRDGGTVAAERVRGESRLDPAAQARVIAAMDAAGLQYLGPIYQAFAGEIPYEELHLLRLYCVCRNRERDARSGSSLE